MRKTKRWCGGMLIGTLALASVPLSAEPSVDQQILEELRLLRQEVAAIGTRMEQLEGKLPTAEAQQTAAEAAAQAEAAMAWERDWEQVKADPEALMEIENQITDTLTEAQAFDLVQKLELLSVGQNSWGSSDRQVLLLSKIGRQHPSVLIDAMQMNGLRHYVEYAIPTVDWTKHQDLVLRNLAEAPELVTVVIRRGWLDEAAPTLVDELSHRQRLPIEWVRAAATVATPDERGALVNYFVQSDSWQIDEVYQILRRAEGVDLDGAVERAWEQRRFDDADERVAVAAIAINHGHADALAELVEALPDDQAEQHPHHFMMHKQTPRTAILRATEARGTNDELRGWYESHRDHLVFDARKKKWLSSMPLAQ